MRFKNTSRTKPSITAKTLTEPMKIPAKALPVALLVFLAACSNPEREFQEIELKPSEQAFSTFVAKYPTHPLADSAKKRVEVLAFQAAQAGKSSQALAAFLKRFPSSSLSPRARIELENITFLEAEKSANISTWESFIASYPSSPHMVEARERVARLHLEVLKGEASVERLKQFAKEFSGTKAAVVANEQMEEIEYRRALNGESIGSYETFIATYPSSKRVGELRSKILAMEHADTLQKDTIEAYDGFLRKYPDSSFGPAVRDKLRSRMEERDWNTALLTNTGDGFISFNDKYPKSDRVIAIEDSWRVSTQMRIGGGMPSMEGVTVFVDPTKNTRYRFTLSLRDAERLGLQQKPQEISGFPGIVSVSLSDDAWRGTIYFISVKGGLSPVATKRR